MADMKLTFGTYDHLDRSDEALGTFFEHRLELAEAYDRVGFRALHIAEHHFTPLGMSPSPSVFLSAVAQRTRRLRFKPLVYTLNLYHPLRLADEICMLDHMSGGRLELGVGRGISPFEVGYFGADPGQGQAMYFEAFEVLMKALRSPAGASLTHDGHYYHYRDVPLELHPLQQPHPPLWYGIGNPDSVVWCAANRVNIVCNGPIGLVRAITDGYRAEWVRLGQDPVRLPFMGVTRHMVIAASEREARELARGAYLKWQGSFMHLFKKHNAQPRFQVWSENFDEVYENGLIFAGTPQTVRSKISTLVEAAGLNYLACRFAFGNLPLAASMRSVELFSSDVLPAFV